MTVYDSKPGSSGGGRDLLKVLTACVVLYLFLVGIGAMGKAFKLIGTDASRELLGVGAQTGPVVALFIGILATTIVQSSSTTTSLVVGLVAAGALPFDAAIYMVMGANVGTTVTNTLVSLGHITRSQEYRRALAAATVHDFFNILVLLVVFPFEVYTGFLTTLSEGAMHAFQDVGGMRLASPIKVITGPAIDALRYLTLGNGIALAIVAVVMTFGSLFVLVRVLRTLMVERLENLFDRTVFRNSVISLIFGFVLTVIVQSSSITTSVVVPLVGAGVLSIRQVFPYTMGANVGTTMTAVLAALAAFAAAQPMHAGAPSPEEMASIRSAEAGLDLAFHHVLFNVVGVALFWFLKGIPIAIAEGFASLAMRNRMIPIVYIVCTFYLIPFLIVWFGR